MPDTPAQQATPEAIGPATVTVLGHIWDGKAPWNGLDFTRAELRETSIWGPDYHLRVPWRHPDDAACQEGHEDECFDRVRPRRRGWRFVQVGGEWMVTNKEPANAG